ncbi:MAG: hypothetical protein IJW49_03295 [Clostridia bacterium]|nr:hypothetical protein [Clostridia bacterium]
MNDRMQKSEYLFREIGNIHDRWVVEALTYQRKRSPVPRVLMIAASVALSASLLVATLLVGMKQLLPLGDHTNTIGGDQSNDAISLDDLLLECKTDQRANYTVLSSPAQLDYFSSDVRVAWQYADSSAVYVSRSLTETETQRLENSIKNSTNATSAEQPACKIWILYGDGRVISPYLHPSIGNTGESELFDYNIEIIPDADFSSCLSEILY